MNRSVARGKNFRTPRAPVVHCVVLYLVIMISGCTNQGADLERIRAVGEFRVALVSRPHTYSFEPQGMQGFDSDLLKAFSARHGLRLKLTHVATASQALSLVANREAHFAAGLIPVTTDLTSGVRFGPSYAMLQAQVIYRSDFQHPRSPADLVNTKISTAAAGLGDLALADIANTTAGLHWEAAPATSSEQLLVRLNTGEIDYAVIPSVDFDLLRLKYPHLNVGFDVGQMHAAAWALSNRWDPSVDKFMSDFFLEIGSNGTRSELWRRYYGHLVSFDFVDARAFLRAYSERLPTFRHMFIESAGNVGIDWRFLTALGYQESHWDPDARSPTGVRGLMMLTRATARRLGVSRLDPGEAIDGGARYIADLESRLARSVADDERMWFAIAAYNVGLGHLEDARKLTHQRGGDPNTWRDVLRHLPLLARPNVARTTRYGRARGGETVHFVRNIRRYFDTIRLLERVDLETPKRPKRFVWSTLRLP